MASVLAARGITHVATDAYANDCHIVYPRYISWALTRRVTHGSILVIHMPERGFRQWIFEALERTFDELESKGLRSVTLSELDAAAAARAD